MIDIVSLLSCDGYIICNKTLIKKFNADCAILVGELCAEYNYYKNLGQLDSDGSFYSTRDNIEQNTGLNDYAQRKAIKMLSEAKILTVTKKGLPAKNYYKLNDSQLLSLFTTGDTASEALDVEPLNINNNKQKIINNNTVISKDITEQSSSEIDLGFGESKPVKLNLYQQCLAIINDYTEDTNIKKMLIDYLDLLLEKMRNEHKVLYANQFKGMLKHLSDLVASREGKLEDIISQSISKGYIGFFPANHNNNYSSGKNVTYRLPEQKIAKDEDKARDENGNFMVF